MSAYDKIKTTPEVWAVIRASHPSLVVFSSFSNPDGRAFGGAGEEGMMHTSFGFSGCDFPLLEAVTRWGIDPEQPYKRINETHQYWLCIGVDES